MSAKQSLGRGFDALIPTEIDAAILETDPSRIQKLLITDIMPNKEQPRRQWDNEMLRELTASIKQHGVLQPIIVVRQGPKNGYRIVAGERRWRAAKAAGLKDIPSIVRSLEELEQVELALIENIQRVDLSPLEQASAVYKLQQQFNLKLEEIAKKLGKAPSTLSNLTRLLQLPTSAHQAMADGKINEGHARAILALKDKPEQQTQLLESILNNGWTVRQAEQFVIRVKRGQRTTTRAVKTGPDDDLVGLLGTKLNTAVRINRRSRGGQIVISFTDDEHLQRIVKKIDS